MGAMALLRQTYSDAKWYAAGNSDTKDRSLEALNKNKNFETKMIKKQSFSKNPLYRNPTGLNRGR